jgi:hypothetical protein
VFPNKKENPQVISQYVHENDQNEDRKLTVHQNQEKKNCKHVVTPYYVNEKLKMKKNIVINDERERERERNPSARKGSHGRGGLGDHLHRERDR